MKKQETNAEGTTNTFRAHCELGARLAMELHCIRRTRRLKTKQSLQDREHSINTKAHIDF